MPAPCLLARPPSGSLNGPMHIRPFRPEDASALAHIFHAAVHRIARLHYSDEQVQAWAPQIPSAEGFRSRRADGRLLLVAADRHDQPLAHGDLEPDGHIDHFYCRPDAAGTGVASALYDALEAEGRGRGLNRLFVEASEPARRFFLRKGFTLLGRRDFDIGGVPIHNFEMEKRL